MIKRFYSILTLALALFILCSGNACGLDITQDTGYLALVNYDHLLDLEDVPQDLLDISQQVPALDKAIPLRPAAAQSYKDMCQALQADGNILIAVSGYRSAQFQADLFQTRLAQRQKQGMSPQQAYDSVSAFTAEPGASEHQLGLAIDVSDRWSLEQSFAATATGQWLEANCWRYGYILRYLEDKSDLTQISFEPWHFRYVGQPHAQIIYENGWCMEEYVQYLQQEKELSFTDSGGNYYTVSWTADPTMEYPFLQDFSSDNAGGYIVTQKYPPALAMALQAIRAQDIYSFNWDIQSA